MTMALGELAGASGAADAAATTSGAGTGAAQGGVTAARGATGAAASGGKSFRQAAAGGGGQKNLRQKISQGEQARSAVGKKAKSLFGPSKAARGRSHARQVLVTEFVICVLVIALMPVTDKHRAETPVTWGRRATAVMLLFVILALVATGGKRSAKVAAGFGGLVTVGLLLSERDLLVVLTKMFTSGSTGGPAGPPSGSTGLPTSSGTAGAFTGALDQLEQGLAGFGNRIARGFQDPGNQLRDFLQRYGISGSQIGGPLVLPPGIPNP